MAERTLIRSRNVFDGKAFLGKKDIVVEGGKIIEVGDSLSCPDIIDVGDDFISPGFVDAHLHVTGNKFGDILKSALYESPGLGQFKVISVLKKMLHSGITTVRDCGNPGGPDIRDAINAGYIEGPRIIAAGRPLSQTFGHGEFSHTLPLEFSKNIWAELCDGVPECIKAARKTLRGGADFIKIFTTGGVLSQNDRPDQEQFTPEEIRAIVNEARKAGTYVAAHAQGDAGIRNAVEGGVKFIEHGTLASENTLKMMAEKRVSLTPTLSIMELIYKDGKSAGIRSENLEKIKMIRDHGGEVINMAKKYGVNIITGTDLGGVTGLDIDFGRNWMEIVLLCEIGGLTPLEALQASTGNCDILGKNIGRIMPGYEADIISLKGNPLESIRDVSKTGIVMKGGNIVRS